MIFRDTCNYCQGQFEFESNELTYLGRLGEGIQMGLFEVVGDENADFFPIHHECYRNHYKPGDRLYE